MTARMLKFRYAAALVLAQIVAAVELTALIMPLQHHLVPAVDTVFETDTLIAAIVLSVCGFARLDRLRRRHRRPQTALVHHRQAAGR